MLRCLKCALLVITIVLISGYVCADDEEIGVDNPTYGPVSPSEKSDVGELGLIAEPPSHLAPVRPSGRQRATASGVPSNGLKRDSPSSADSKSTLKQRRDQALAPLPGAQDIDYSVDGPGLFSVSYTLKERYPANSSLRKLARRLRSAGWHPLQEDWLNPGIPSSHSRGWESFRDETATVPLMTNQWSGQWADESGNVVGYILLCTGKSQTAANASVISVHASWTSASRASQLQQDVDSIRSMSVFGPLACAICMALVLLVCFAGWYFRFWRVRRSRAT
jgi:hypothetical protein